MIGLSLAEPSPGKFMLEYLLLGSVVREAVSNRL
jgi:hypothetical protein